MGTQNISLLSLPVAAAVALTAKRFVTLGGAVAAAAGAAGGVTRSDAAAGTLTTVDVLGTAVVTAGGAIAKHAYVEVGANGKAVTKAAGKVVAQALEAASGDGADIEVLLIQSS
jgi:uncharacterized ParB-like nuclease family protein